MHWGSGSALFVRPVHWVLMLFGQEVVPATLLEASSGHSTYGHRFHAPKALRITSPGAYERTLRERGRVLADFVARRERIRAEVNSLATSLNGRALIEEALLEEVTALVEWPVALAGHFEERFLALPREVLISTLQEHQRYFPLEDAAGQLLPAFITISNIESRDPAKVREGNERVVRPRLADAAFFWEQDRRQPLAARAPALDAVTFQAKLGSLGDKMRRVIALATDVAVAINGPPDETRRAAQLAKCDMLTAMVGEPPAGRRWQLHARADGETAEVAAAIREHYLPRAAAMPATRSGVAWRSPTVSIRRRLAIGERPTGNKDPFGAAPRLAQRILSRRRSARPETPHRLAVAAVRVDIDRLRA